MVKDRAGRLVNHLRLSVTDRCDQRCIYCMPSCGVTKVSRQDILGIEEMVLVARILRERFGLVAVRLTGGEPLIRTGIVDLTSRLADLGLDDLAMTTNGQTLGALARPLALAGLMRVNVSLDTLDQDVYSRITRGGNVASTLAGIDAALDAGLRPVRINAVMLRGTNEDQVVPLARWAMDRGVEMRFLELMPVGVAREIHDDLFVPASRVLAILRQGFASVKGPVDRTPTASMYDVVDGTGRSGRIGMITPQTEPFCERCQRIRMTAAGKLHGCLHDERGVDLRDALRAVGGPDEEAIQALVVRAVAEKPACRPGSRRSLMNVVGG